MMKRLIAIVEDDENDYLRLREKIDKFSGRHNIEFEVEWFKSGHDFFQVDNNHYSVIFLDIEIGDYDGITVAKKIREENSVSSIIFITNIAKYVQFGYEVDAISYLIKPVSYDSFSVVFEKAINVVASKEKNDVLFKIPGGAEVTSLNNLMYVEVVSHIIIYHLVNGTIEKTGSLSKIEKELTKYGFLRCHNAYIINPKFVKGIDKNNVIIGSKLIPLARSQKKKFLEALSAYYFNQG